MNKTTKQLIVEAIENEEDTAIVYRIRANWDINKTIEVEEIKTYIQNGRYFRSSYPSGHGYICNEDSTDKISFDFRDNARCAEVYTLNKEKVPELIKELAQSLIRKAKDVYDKAKRELDETVDAMEKYV